MDRLLYKYQAAWTVRISGRPQGVREAQMLGTTSFGGDLGPLPPVRGAMASGRPRPGTPGSLMRRMVAVAIDISVAVVCLVGPLLWILDPVLDALDQPVEQERAVFRLTAVLWLTAFGLLYSPVCVSRWGGTPGKRAMGLEVVRADAGAGRLSYGKAVLRHAVNVVTYTVTPLTIAQVTAITLSEDKRSVADKSAGSAVVRR
ncbi:RDD family protein [Streptomyces sp. NPDC056390]|uniref:RDD family protein n=1 Tax=Streptomyces sp. NPDC056390 TaxID=3345806 RepID=UPI0035D996D3